MATTVAAGSITIIDVMDGASGGSLAVSFSRALSFTATDGVLDLGQANITFTANANGVTVSSYLWEFSGFDTSPTNSGTYAQTVTAAQFGSSKSATVTCTINGEYSESFTIVRLEKSTAAAGATVGAPTGTYVGGVLAETVAGKAEGALQKAGDAITGPVTFATNGGILAATDADNGVFMGPNGLVGKKAGETTFAISTDGTAYFDGAYMREGSVGNAQIGAAAINGAHIDEAAINSAHIGELSVDSLRIQGGAVTYTNMVSMVFASSLGDSGNLDVGSIYFGDIASEGSLLKIYICPTPGSTVASNTISSGVLAVSVNGSTWSNVWDTGTGYNSVLSGAWALPLSPVMYGATPAFEWNDRSKPSRQLMADYGVAGSGVRTFKYLVTETGDYTFKCAADNYLVAGSSNFTVGSRLNFPVTYTGYSATPPYTQTFSAVAGEIITVNLQYGNSGGASGVGACITSSNGTVVWNTRRPNYNENSYKYARLRIAKSNSKINSWLIVEVVRK